MVDRLVDALPAGSLDSEPAVPFADQSKAFERLSFVGHTYLDTKGNALPGGG